MDETYTSEDKQDLRKAGDAARRMSLREAWDDLKPHEKRKAIGAAVVAGAVLTGTAAVGIPKAVEAIDGIDYAPDTTTYTVQEGDGWYDVVESIPGIESVDKREVISHVQADPANIDALTAGLKPGQSITIPMNVAP